MSCLKSADSAQDGVWGAPPSTARTFFIAVFGTCCYYLTIATLKSILFSSNC